MLFDLILASESPRRRQLLSEAGFQFTISPSKISENLRKNLNIDEQIIDLARRKAKAIELEVSNQPALVLAADTMVIQDGELIGKPADHEEAYLILRRLSGRSHFVKTGVVIINTLSQLEIVHLETSEVLFRPLTSEEIREYIATGEPMDKAGAYGAQGKGGQFIAELKGSFSNVMGLPMEALTKILAEGPWKLRRS